MEGGIVFRSQAKLTNVSPAPISRRFPGCGMSPSCCLGVDAPCRGLIVLAELEVAISRDPAIRGQHSLSSAVEKLPPVPNTHGQPNTGTAANKGMWQGMAFGQVSPDPTLQGGWRRALGQHVQWLGERGKRDPAIAVALSPPHDAQWAGRTESRAI